MWAKPSNNMVALEGLIEQIKNWGLIWKQKLFGIIFFLNETTCFVQNNALTDPHYLGLLVPNPNSLVWHPLLDPINMALVPLSDPWRSIPKALGSDSHA